MGEWRGGFVDVSMPVLVQKRFECRVAVQGMYYFLHCGIAELVVA